MSRYIRQTTQKLMTIFITIAVVFFLVIPLLVAIFVSLTSPSDGARRRAIFAAGALTIAGKVTAVGTRPDGTAHFSGYQYKVEGKSYQSAQKVQQGPVLTKGMDVQIRYSLRQPEIALLIGKGLENTEGTNPMRAVIVVCALALLLVSFIALIFDLTRLFG